MPMSAPAASRLPLGGLRWLPRRLEPKELGIQASWRDRVRRSRDFLIATLGGGGMALLAYLVLTRDQSESIADFFLESGFARCFADKGCMSDYFKGIPVWLVTAPYSGLMGAGVALEQSVPV